MDALEGDLKTDAKRKHDASFRSFLRRGLVPGRIDKGINDEERSILRDFRDMGTANSGAGIATVGGGVFVPVGFINEVDENMKYATPMMDADVVTLVDTENANILPFPTDDDTSVNAELQPEGMQGTYADIAAISSANLKAYKFGSKMIRASYELVQDENVDFPGYLAKRFASRFGRGIGPYLTTGTGGGTQPTGFVTTAQSGGTAVGNGTDDGTSGANTIGADDLATLESSVDYGWRSRARWMFHSSTLAWFRKAKDKQGRRLYPELNHGLLAGYPYSVNNAMDQLQTQVGSPPVTKTPIAFGAFDQYVTRRRAMTVARLPERFADFFEVGFLAWWRVDGALLQPSAIKTMNTIY